MFSTLSQTSPGFYVQYKCFENTVVKKEKLLVTSNFSFSHSVFYPFIEPSAIHIKLKFVVCKLFPLGRVKKIVVWERVNLDKSKVWISGNDLLKVPIAPN